MYEKIFLCKRHNIKEIIYFFFLVQERSNENIFVLKTSFCEVCLSNILKSTYYENKNVPNATNFDSTILLLQEIIQEHYNNAKMT